MSDQMLLSLVPDTHGRSAAGVSQTTTGHASATAVIAAPPASSCRTAASRPRGAIHSHAAAIPGTTIRAAAILASNPRPTHYAGQHEPAGAPVSETADQRPNSREGAQHEQRVG